MTPSEIARQIAEKICLGLDWEGCNRVYEIDKAAAIIEPEVRELVEENERLRKLVEILQEIKSLAERETTMLRLALTQPKEPEQCVTW